MGTVTVVTDSSACLPRPLASTREVSVLPILVHVGDDTFDDGHTASSTVYRAISGGAETKTSPVTAAAYLRALIEQTGGDAVIVTPAAEFTVMNRNARLAASLAGTSVAVVDSRTAAASQGLVVWEAARAASRGLALHEVEAAARGAAARVHLVAAVDAMRVLRSSGRVRPELLESEGRAGASIALFELAAGSVKRLGVSPRADEALDGLAAAWQAGRGTGAARTVVFHAAAPERAADLRARVSQVDHVVEFTAALGVHTGPGVVGVAWIDPP